MIQLPKEFIKKYRAAAKKYKLGGAKIPPETEDDAREITRYLLVNGHILITPENLAMGPKHEFYLDVDGCPDFLKEQCDQIMTHEDVEWTQEDDPEEDNVRDEKTPEVIGVWIQEGKVNSVKVRTRYTADITKEEFASV